MSQLRDSNVSINSDPTTNTMDVDGGISAYNMHPEPEPVILVYYELTDRTNPNNNTDDQYTITSIETGWRVYS